MFKKSAAPSAGGYTLTKSLRFRSSASAYLSKTYGTSPTSRTTMTMSMWVKRGALSVGSGSAIYGTGGNWEGAYFNSSDQLRIQGPYSSGQQGVLVTSQVFRDPSAWYHIVIVYDTTNATASNRLRLYVNGVQVTSFGTQTNSNQNNTTTQWLVSGQESDIGDTGGGTKFDGYIAEVNVIDGQQLDPTSFGSTNSTTGVWQPIAYTGTYGTNGFYLPFTNTTSTTTLGNDSSGNGNNWTTNNFSLTAGSTYDSMTDVPTLTSATTANYAVMNPVNTGGYATIVNGNLQVTMTDNATSRTSFGTMAVSSGKYYWEVTIVTAVAPYYPGIGVNTNLSLSPSAQSGDTSTGYMYLLNGQKFNNGTLTNYGSSFTTNDVMGVALDMDAGTIIFYKNNTSQGQAFSGITGTAVPCIVGGGGVSAVNFGQQPFTYTPPTGYVALNTYNLPTSTIVKGNTVMDATTYTGTGASLSVTNAGFKPDLVWIKSRSAATDHKLTDSVRGTTKALISDTTGAETTDANGLTAFGTSGFTVGTDTVYNNNTATYVGWQWQAGQGTTSSNTNGSVTSTVSVNATAGFSVVSFTTAGSGSSMTIGHGLGVAPSLIITKLTQNGASGWNTYHSALGNTKVMVLNTTAAAATDSSVWNNTSPTSSVFTLGSAYVGGAPMIAYCWAEIAGFSQFGSYTGNGSSDGPFIFTGFRPKFVMIKAYSGGSSPGDQLWYIFDSARDTYNLTGNKLFANNYSSENSGQTTSENAIDFLSNGFKCRASNDGTNSSNNYIYMAFAENPFKNALAR